MTQEEATHIYNELDKINPVERELLLQKIHQIHLLVEPLPENPSKFEENGGEKRLNELKREIIQDVKRITGLDRIFYCEFVMAYLNAGIVFNFDPTKTDWNVENKNAEKSETEGAGQTACVGSSSGRICTSGIGSLDETDAGNG